MDETTKTPAAEEPTPQPPTIGEPRPEGVGDIMKESTRRGMVKVIMAGSVVVYLLMIGYAEAHGINMLSRGVAPDFLFWAYGGMVALGITAILLPLALHFWTHEATHRTAALLFYVIDLILLGVNTFTDYGSNTGAQLATWAQLYKDYVMPATPVIAGIGWSILWLLDPSNKALALRLTLRAAMLEKKANQIMRAANNPAINDIVDAAAVREVEETLTELFGAPVTGYVVRAGDMRTASQRRGLLQSFFGWLSTGIQSKARRGQSDDTPPQSPPSS